MTYRYLANRLLWAIGVLFAATVIIFLLVGALGNPLAQMRLQEPPLPQHVIEQEAQRLGLNDPIWLRYLNWITGLFHGNFGPSIEPTMDIGAELGSRLLISFQLVGWALLIAFLLAIFIGTLSAVKPGGRLDLTSTTVSFILIAFPSFWTAVLLKQFGILFNTSSESTVFYTLGPRSPVPPEGMFDSALDIFGHMILPTISLAVVHFASWNRYHRSGVLDSISSAYTTSAVLRGLSYPRVLWHAVRPALIPIITVVALDIPVLFSGTMITEIVFQWQGMGAYLKQSIESNDMNALMGWMLIAASAVLVFNLLTDVLYLILDPRIRYEEPSS